MKKLLLICLVTLCAGRIYAQNWQNVQAPWGQNCPVFIPNGYQFQGFVKQNNGFFANYWHNNQLFSQPVFLNQNRGVVITQFILNAAQGVLNQITFSNQGLINNQPVIFNQNCDRNRIYYYDHTGRLCWRY